MVLCLKAWESRTLPGLLNVKYFHFKIVKVLILITRVMQIEPTTFFRKFIKFIKLILPPFLFTLIKFSLLKFNLVGNVKVLSSQKFVTWWADFKHRSDLKNVDIDIINMMDTFIQSNAFKNSSSYWKWLCKNHIEIIEKYGIENFKLIIEKSAYWGEGNLESPHVKQIINNDVTVDLSIDEVFR